MKPIKSCDEISVVTPCFNDFTAFQDTISSLKNELQERDELIVIDSSDDAAVVPRIIKSIDLRCRVSMQWQAPNGVYSALNTGLKTAMAPWIQIINSGDKYLSGAREQISLALSRSPQVDIHVFRQQAGCDLLHAYVFTPNAKSVWPHQSIVVARQVHELLGWYDTSLKITADQVFFARARGVFSWRLHDFVLTSYDLNGMSSIVSLSISKELYHMWRAFGRGPLDSAFRAWVRPALRTAIERTIGQQKMHMVKRLLLNHYR